MVLSPFGIVFANIPKLERFKPLSVIVLDFTI